VLGRKSHVVRVRHDQRGCSADGAVFHHRVRNLAVGGTLRKGPCGCIYRILVTAEMLEAA
jgi:hypothetical protein